MAVALAVAACSSQTQGSSSPASAGNGGAAGASGGKGGSAGSAAGRSAGGRAGAAGESGAPGESGAAGESGGGGAPGGALRFSGTATADFEPGGEGGAGGESAFPPIDHVECSFYGELLDVMENDAGGLSGVAIGEVFRNIYSGDQRWEFSAFIAGPATLTLLADDRVEFRAVGEQPAGAKPFWRELEVLSGTAVGPSSYEGAWTCASLDQNEPGFPDVGHEAQGTWELGPSP